MHGFRVDANKLGRGGRALVFCHKSSDFLDYKGVAVFGMAKEFATVSRERIYVEECAEGVELT